MTCKCCVSLRGLAYFGASSHIVVGAMFFVEFIESLFSITQSKLFETETINSGTERLVYHWVFLSLGFLIFQGIDRESKTLLKRSAIIFLILQVLTLAVRVKYGYMYSSTALSKPPCSPDSRPITLAHPDSGLYRGLTFSIVITGAYLLILFFYVRKLESSMHSGRLFRPHSTTTHIPLSTTNFGWYSQSHSSRSSRGGSNNSALYSPLNIFGGVVGAAGFNPVMWTNPGPPPPYSDAAPPLETQLGRHMTAPHAHVIQPCSSRTMMNPGSHETTDKNLSARNCDRTEPDPSVVPLLEDENEDKSGLEC